MAIWTRHKSPARDTPGPLEQQAIADLAAPGADADQLIENAVSEARTHSRLARTRADKVVIGFTLSGELDALARDLDRSERTGDDRADLIAARGLDARACHLANQALAQQRNNATRTTSAAAAMIITNQNIDR